jgi:hypothetical protein
MVRVLRRQCEGPRRRYAIHDDRLHRTVTIREVARTAGEVDRHRLDLPSPARGLSSDRAWWSSPATQCGSRRRGSIANATAEAILPRASRSDGPGASERGGDDLQDLPVIHRGGTYSTPAPAPPYAPPPHAPTPLYYG